MLTHDCNKLKYGSKNLKQNIDLCKIMKIYFYAGVDKQGGYLNKFI